MAHTDIAPHYVWGLSDRNGNVLANGVAEPHIMAAPSVPPADFNVWVELRIARSVASEWMRRNQPKGLFVLHAVVVNPQGRPPLFIAFRFHPEGGAENIGVVSSEKHAHEAYRMGGCKDTMMFYISPEDRFFTIEATT